MYNSLDKTIKDLVWPGTLYKNRIQVDLLQIKLIPTFIEI
jgi:hypothetical protein